MLLYSHDSFGLGHIRRTLSVCEAIQAHDAGASLLVVTGSSAVSTLPMPAGVDWVKLPCVTKIDDGQYRSRFLPLAFNSIRSVRRDIVHSTARAYRPSLVFVDNVPRGLEGELLPTLQWLRRMVPGIRIVLTLRDVIDEPARVIETWRRQGTLEAVDRLYDDIVIFGSPEVFDAVVEYQLPPRLVARCHYAGYLSRQPAGRVVQTRERLLRGADRLVLVTVGGGGDGGALVGHYLDGLQTHGLTMPDQRVQHVVVCGPEMPDRDRGALQAIAARRSDVTMIDACHDLVTAMAAADVVVSMGGYNTVCEILSLKKPAVVMPRRWPRLEQWIRCTRMEALGVFRVVHPDQDPSRALMHEVRQLLIGSHVPSVEIDLGGINRLARLLPVLLTAPSAA